LLGVPAHSADFPSRHVTFIVPSTPGGGLDQVARTLAHELGTLWKQPVVVENRTGASGAIGAAALLAAPPDGHTLLLLNESILVGNRFAFKKLPYNPDQFTLLTRVVEADYYLVANASVQASNLAELSKQVRAARSSYSYGSWGPGSTPNLLFETLNQIDGMSVVGVPYRGAAPALLAVLANEVQLGIATSLSGGPHFKSGTLKPLAIASTRRSSEYPNVPTTVELGYPDLLASLWFGIVGPARLPSGLATSIATDVRRIIEDPKVVNKHPVLQHYPVTERGGAAEFTERMKRDTEVFARLAKAAKLEPQ